MCVFSHASIVALDLRIVVAKCKGANAGAVAMHRLAVATVMIAGIRAPGWLTCWFRLNRSGDAGIGRYIVSALKAPLPPADVLAMKAEPTEPTGKRLGIGDIAMGVMLGIVGATVVLSALLIAYVRFKTGEFPRWVFESA